MIAPEVEGAFDEAGRFSILRKLGEGGMGVVYEVRDHERGETVALKTIGRPDAKGIYRLKKEFRALTGIRHPHLVEIHELGCTDERWFFTMDLVDGCDFIRHVRGQTSPAAATVTGDLAFDWYLNATPRPSAPGSSSGAFDEDLLREATWQLASALVALHRAGRVHRDVKPSNVLVDVRKGVRVLDFGIARAFDRSDVSLESAVVGTPAYMAPEQATGDPVGPAADWYAVGVMLYESLTGVVPFGGSVIDVLTSKQTSDAPDPRDVLPELPRDLADLCVALLAPDPAERPSGDDVVAALARGDEVAAAPLLDAIAETVGFVGRGAEVERLRAACETSRQRAVLMQLHGVEGVGKTALARHALRGLGRETLVLAGSCHPHESVPYKALDAVVDALARYLNSHEPAREAALAIDGMAALVRLFPVLGRVRGWADLPSDGAADRHRLRRRAFAALRAVLGWLAARSPLVLMVDDAQWGDADSAALLTELLRPPDAPSLLVLLVHRSDDAAASPLLARIAARRFREEVGVERRELELLPLDEEDAAQLARRMLPAACAQDVAVLVVQAGGQPRLLAQLAAHVRAGGGIDRDTLQTSVADRLARVPPDALPLLELLAVAGGALSVAVTSELLGDVAEGEALRGLTRRTLVPDRDGRAREVLDLDHQGVRQMLLTRMSAEQRRQRHAALGVALERAGAIELAAWHHEHAGATGRAHALWLHAASAARDALAFDRTAELLGRALSLDVKASEQRWLLGQLGDALSAAGRGVEAADAYLRAAQTPNVGDGVLQPARETLDLRRLAAEHLMKSGRIDEGLMVMREVLAELGMRLPSTPRRALMALGVQRARLAMRGLEPSSGAALDLPERQRMDACWSLAVGLSMADTVMGAYFHARHLALALDSGDAPRVSRALALEAAHVASTSSERHERSLSLLERSARLAEDLGDPHALAMVTLMRGGQALFASRWRDAVTLCDASLSLLANCTDNVMWETGSAWRFGFTGLFYLGELAELDRRVPLALAEARARGDRFAQSCARSGSSVVVWLTRGDVAGARRQLAEERHRWSGGRFALQHYLRLQAESYVDLYEGRGAAALQRLHADWRRLDRSMLLRVQLLRSTMWALRGRAALSGGGELREARTAALKLEAEGLPAPKAQALGLRAALAGRSGRLDAAVASYREAAAQFAALGMTLMASAMDARRGVLVGGDEGRTLVSSADRALRAQGVADPQAMLQLLAPDSAH